MDECKVKLKTGIPSVEYIEEYFTNEFDKSPLDKSVLDKLTEFRELVAANKVWRKHLQFEVYQRICDLGIRIATELAKDDSLKNLLMAEIFRFCRNTCTYSESNQMMVGLRTDLGWQAIDYARNVIIADGEGLEDGNDKVIVAQCAIQATCNSLTGCEDVCQQYVDDFNYVEDLITYVDHPIIKLAYYSTLTLLEIYKIRPHRSPGNLSTPHSDAELESEDPEKLNPYDDLFSKALCRFSEFVDNNLSTMSRNDRLVALENLTSSSGFEHQRMMTLPVLSKFMELYKEQADTLLSDELHQISDDDEGLEELKSFLVLILTLASFENEKLPYMQADEKFVTSTVGVLCRIQEFGKSGNNCFTPVEKLDFVASTGAGSHEIESHPSFRLKMRLIALLTYLCSNHERNQNITRTNDGLSVILECTRIDARNPYLPQYAILAIRTLLEGNLENQNFVKEMDKQGFGDSSVLNEFGIQLKDNV